MSGKRTGTADLPLHPGRAPRWLMQRMVKLSGAVSSAVIDEHGQDGFLRRISDPVWFQAFSCVLGFDWHSSGTTTTTCGALKVSLGPEHGIFVAGGKGSRALGAPKEITLSPVEDALAENLVRASRLSAKVDNACVQDGFNIYHHAFFFTGDGKWAVVQQGMNPDLRTARRYHWLSERVRSFVDEPHTGICCDATVDSVLDLTSRLNEGARDCSVDLVKEDPRHIRRYFTRRGFQSALSEFGKGCEPIPRLAMPQRHEIEPIDISDRGMQTLSKLYELQPTTYEDLIALRGAGPQLVRALALVSNLIYGCGISWKDTAMYSFAHGGKDGIPFPVDRKTYDATIETLRSALDQARLERREKMNALRRLGEWVDGCTNGHG